MVKPLRLGKLLVLSLCVLRVLLPTWAGWSSSAPFANFAAPRFRGTRRQGEPLSRNALSPVIQAWQLQQERDREYDELLRGGFSKEKMLLRWESMARGVNGFLCPRVINHGNATLTIMTTYR